MDKKWQIEKCTIPQCASVTKNPDNETTEQVIWRQENLLKLPEDIKEKLVSYETSKKIQQIGETFNLKLLQMADISRAIRSYYFGEIMLENFPSIFSKEMNIDTPKAQEISQAVVKNIIKDSSYEISYESRFENISLQKALKEYPELGEQLVTSSHIKLKNFPDPVRPSIKNWIADYTWQLGHGRHNSMERSNYIFQGANSKTLNPQDRQKLSYLLKSLDENIPITINKNTRQIAFEKITADLQKSARNAEQVLPNNISAPARNAVPQNKVASGSYRPQTETPRLQPMITPSPQAPKDSRDSNIKFSFPQKLSYEKNQLKPSFPPPQINPGNLPKKPQTEKKDERVLGKNVVNLKE